MNEMLNYESIKDPVLPRKEFFRRMRIHISYSGLLLLGSLALGIVGFMVTFHLPVVDSFLNASMLLGGMGPVDVPKTNAAKIFAALYALYAGLVFLIVASILFAPVFHRVLHRFHIEKSKRS